MAAAAPAPTRPDPRGEMLREAAASGDADKVKRLASGGVDVNSQNKMNGWTALHWACKRDHPVTVEALLMAGSNPGVKNTKGEVPADLAGPKVASGTTLFAAMGREIPDIDEVAKKHEEAKPALVPNYLRNPHFFYADDPSPPTGISKTMPPPPPAAPTATATTPTATAATPATPTTTTVHAAAAAAAAPRTVGADCGGAAGVGLVGDIVRHLMGECAALRTRLSALEARSAAADECFDVVVGHPAIKAIRVVGVAGNTPLTKIVEVVQASVPKLAAAGELVLAPAERGQAGDGDGPVVLLMEQTCGRLRRHLMPTARPDEPLTLSLGLKPRSAK